MFRRTLTSKIRRGRLYPSEGVPTNIALPTLSGTPTENVAVTCSTGSWSNFPSSYAYQWLFDGVAISGATTNSYTPTTGDVTKTISCRVTPTNFFGSGATAETEDAVVVMSTVPLRTFKVSATDPAASYTTVAEVNAATFLPGDAILFKGGETFTGPLTIPSSGNSSNRITFGAYGGGKPTLTSTGEGVGLVGKQYVDIRDLILVGPGQTVAKTTTTGAGVRLWAAASSTVALGGPRVINCAISAFPYCGIMCQGVSGGKRGWDGTQLRYNSISNCTGGAITGSSITASNGITFEGFFPAGASNHSHTNVLIEYNTITGCIGVPDANGSGHSGAGMVIQQTDTVTVQRNHVENNGINSFGSVGIFFYDVKSGTIRYNVAASQHVLPAWTADGVGMGFDAGCVNCLCEFNYAVNCDGAGFYAYSYDDSGLAQCTGNVMRYNIAENNGIGTGAMTEDTHAQFYWKNDDVRPYQCHWYGNTGYSERAHAAVFSIVQNGKCQGYVANNLFQVGSTTTRYVRLEGNRPNQFGAGASCYLVNNCYSGETTEAVEWQGGGTAYANVSAWLADVTGASDQERISSAIYAITSQAHLSRTANVGVITDYTPAALAGYTLASGSPLADAGLNVTTLPSISYGPPSSVGTTDAFGNTIPVGSGYSVGASDTVALSTASEAVIATTYLVSGTASGTGGTYTGASASGGAGLRDGTDNTGSSIWAHDATDPFITADCGASKTITKMVIRPVGGGFDSWTAGSLYGRRVDISTNGTTWTYAGHITVPVVGSDYTFPLGSVTARYVRISIAGDHSLALATFKVYGY